MDDSMLHFGVKNNERWDLHVAYYVAVKYNLQTGERGREGFIVSNKVATDLVREGSLIYRPYLHDNKEIYYHPDDWPLKFTPQDNQYLMGSSSSCLVNCEVAPPGWKEPNPKYRSNKSFAYAIYCKEQAEKPIPLMYSPGYNIPPPQMNYAFSPFPPAPGYFGSSQPIRYTFDLPSTSSPINSPNFGASTSGYTQNQYINYERLYSPVPYQGYYNTPSSSNASFDGQFIPVLQPVPSNKKRNISRAQSRQVSKSRSNVRLETKDVSNYQSSQHVVQKGSPNGEARGASMNAAPSVDATQSVDAAPAPQAIPDGVVEQHEKPTIAEVSAEIVEEVSKSRSNVRLETKDASNYQSSQHVVQKGSPNGEARGASMNAAPSVDATQSVDAAPAPQAIPDGVVEQHEKPTIAEVSAEIVEEAVQEAQTAPVQTKKQKRRQQRKKGKEKAAAEEAQLDRDLEEMRKKDREDLQKQFNRFPAALDHYIDIHSDYRNKHFALRCHMSENITGVQKSIVEFYRTRCVFKVATLIKQDPFFGTFFDVKRTELSDGSDPRLFYLLDTLIPLVDTTPIIQQDLYWLYETRKQSTWLEQVDALYKFILYSPHMRTPEIRWYTKDDVKQHLPSFLEKYGNKPYESFAEYLNRNIKMRSMKLVHPTGIRPLCKFEQRINEEYVAGANIDVKWNSKMSKHLANLFSDSFKSSKELQWKECTDFFSCLATLGSDIIDYDFSKLDEVVEDFDLAIAGYCALLRGFITSEPDKWVDDFLLYDSE